MSKIKVQQPVTHLPSFKTWGVPCSYVDEIVRELGLELLYPRGVNEWYYYTDREGCSVLLPHLLLKSDLFKPSTFTCIYYAFKVWVTCGEKYDLNTWVPIIGTIPNYKPNHAWDLIMLGDAKGMNPDEFLFFEPNDGWQMGMELELAYQVFPIGEAGYRGKFIFY